MAASLKHLWQDAGFVGIEYETMKCIYLTRRRPSLTLRHIHHCRNFTSILLPTYYKISLFICVLFNLWSHACLETAIKTLNHGRVSGEQCSWSIHYLFRLDISTSKYIFYESHCVLENGAWMLKKIALKVSVKEWEQHQTLCFWHCPS